MNYIYDIYLNLNTVPYDFFDWNKNDNLIHIKKIPIFKINEENFKEIVNNKIKIDLNFLNSLHNKTELWKKNENINYCSLFCDCNNIIAIQFNNLGISIKKSFLFIDEELEILETTQKLKEIKLNFEILNKQSITFKTRKQIQKEKFINQELLNTESSKLNYIYFECFGKSGNNKKNIIKDIKKLSKNGKAYEKLYEILKLTSTTKNKML